MDMIGATAIRLSSARFPSQMPVGYHDGEAIVQDGNGASDFEALRSAMRWKPQSIILYAFDLLHLDGKDFRQQTLLERRADLKALIGNDADNRIQFSDEFDGDGHALFKACAERTLEGIVSKQALAPYRSGRSKTWLKTKCFTESTFVVIGTDRDRKTGALRALLAHKDSDGLKYAGAAFIILVYQKACTMSGTFVSRTTETPFNGSGKEESAFKPFLNPPRTFLQ